MCKSWLRNNVTDVARFYAWADVHYVHGFIESVYNIEKRQLNFSILVNAVMEQSTVLASIIWTSSTMNYLVPHQRERDLSCTLRRLRSKRFDYSSHNLNNCMFLVIMLNHDTSMCLGDFPCYIHVWKVILARYGRRKKTLFLFLSLS